MNEESMENKQREIFMAQIKGFYAGAGVKIYDERFNRDQVPPYIREAYQQGFDDGVMARCAYAEELSDKTGYTPSPLRLQEIQEEP